MRLKKNISLLRIEYAHDHPYMSTSIYIDRLIIDSTPSYTDGHRSTN